MNHISRFIAFWQSALSIELYKEHLRTYSIVRRFLKFSTYPSLAMILFWESAWLIQATGVVKSPLFDICFVAYPTLFTLLFLIHFLFALGIFLSPPIPKKLRILCCITLLFPFAGIYASDYLTQMPDMFFNDCIFLYEQ